MPEWLEKEEDYDAVRDNDSWLAKSALSIVSKLNAFRSAQMSYGQLGRSFPPVLKLLLMLAMILAVSLVRNMLYVYIALAIVLIHVCFLRGEHLRRTVAGSAAATFISALILLPSVFLGSPTSLLTVSLKVCVCVTLVGILSSTTSWNRLTAGLASLHVPDVFIFTLDITLKYIVILGDLCLDMLNALRLRSVGRNRSPASSLSGILGHAFLVSRHMANEMYDAMRCRGFEGEYRRLGSREVRK